MPATKSQQLLEQLLDPEVADALWKTIPAFHMRDRSRWDGVIKRSKNKRLVAGLKRLSVMPFRNFEESATLLKFCLKEMPQVEAQCEAKNDSPKKQLCALLRSFVVMALQGRSLYPYDPIALGTRVLRIINGTSRCSKQFKLLADVLTDPNDGTPRAGWNTVVSKSSRRLIEHETELGLHWFDGFVAAKHKLNEYCEKVTRNRQFREDWQNIKSSFQVASYQGAFGVIWPSWNKDTAAPATLNPDTEIGRFFVVFDFFCWKWFLSGMCDDTAFVETPRYRLTPVGTEIFIPGYLSLDAHRDVLWKRVLELHRARGVPRQGAKLTNNRKQRNVQLKNILQAELEARKKGLRGEDRYVHLKTKAGLHRDCDDSYVHRLLHQAKQMFPASHAQPQ